MVSKRTTDKVVIFHHCDDIGGAGMSLYNLYRMLIEKYEVVIYVPNKDMPMYNFLTERGVCCKELGGGIGQICAYSGGPKVLSRDYILKAIKILLSYFTLKKIVENEKPQIVIVNSVTLSWVGRLTKKMGVFSACYVRETYANVLGMKTSINFLDKYFDGIIFISNYDKEHFGCHNKRQAVVYNSVSREDYMLNESRSQACEILGLDERKFNVLYVGGNAAPELKGYPTLCRAAENLKKEDISVVICGKLVSEVDKKNMIALGMQTNIPLVYRACDVLVFPSGKPHQARPAFEAGFMKLPVIISNFEQTKEDVIDGYNGLTFEPGEAEMLAEKIMLLYNNREECTEMGKRNYNHSIKMHEFESCKKILFAFIEQLYN